MTHTRIQVQHTRDVLCIFDAEIEHVVEPILTKAIPILDGYGDRILLAAKKAIQFEFDFNFVTLFKVAQVGTFDARVRSKNVHPDAITDQNSDHGIRTGF